MLANYQISLTESYCSKQKLTSCVMSSITNFLAGFVQKISLTKVKLFSVTSVELWVHIKCNNPNYLDYRYLQNCHESWYCIEFCCTRFLFNSLFTNKNLLDCCANTDNNTTQWIFLKNEHNSSLLLKLSSNLKLLVNQFNNATPEKSYDPEKICSSKYYDIEEMHNIEIPHKSKLLSLFHINPCSPNTNFDDLQLY